MRVRIAAHWALALVALFQEGTESFLPSLDYGQRSVDEWLVELEQPDEDALQAAWSLFYWDVRDANVVEALLAKRDSADIETSRAIDTILLEWRVPHEVLGTRAYFGPRRFPKQAHEMLPLPARTLDGTPADWITELSAEDSKLRARAALSLILAGEHVEQAMRALLAVEGVPESKRPWGETPSGSAREVFWWARDYVGSPLGEALGAELAAAGDDERRLALLSEELWSSIHESTPALRSALTPLLNQDGSVGETAWKVFARHSGFWKTQMNRDDSWYHVGSRDFEGTPENDADATAHRMWVARILSERLARHAEATDPMLVKHVHSVGSWNLRVRDACSPYLLNLLVEERPDPDSAAGEALRALEHFGIDGALTRARYVHAIAEWPLDRIPCRKTHDEETLSALERRFRSSDSKYAFIDPLAFAGLGDSSHSPMARTLLDQLASLEFFSPWLPRKGYRGLVPIGEADDRVTRVNKAALCIATLKERGEDFSEYAARIAEVLNGPYEAGGAGGYHDYYEFGYLHALEYDLRGPEFVRAALKVVELGGWPDGFETHLGYAAALLEGAEMTPRQAARANDLLPYSASGPGTWQVLSMVSVQERAQAARSKVERVPKYRFALYMGDVTALADILATTHLIERDEDYLIAVLERGSVGQRRWALELVHDHHLGTARVREAVKRRSGDCNPRVRAYAREIAGELGW